MGGGRWRTGGGFSRVMEWRLVPEDGPEGLLDLIDLSKGQGEVGDPLRGMHTMGTRKVSRLQVMQRNISCGNVQHKRNVI